MEVSQVGDKQPYSVREWEFWEGKVQYLSKWLITPPLSLS